MAKSLLNFKGGKGLGMLIPVVVGGAIGVFAYKTIFEKAEQDRLLKEYAMKSLAQQKASGAGSQAIDLSYNTIPYTELTSTTEWNPEDLNFSGSISTAGKGFELTVPYSPI